MSGGKPVTVRKARIRRDYSRPRLFLFLGLAAALLLAAIFADLL